MIQRNKEMAWVTFLSDDFEQKWHPVTDAFGQQLEWDAAAVWKAVCISNFADPEGTRSLGIANTSQMLLGNAIKDNF